MSACGVFLSLEGVSNGLGSNVAAFCFFGRPDRDLCGGVGLMGVWIWLWLWVGVGVKSRFDNGVEVMGVLIWLGPGLWVRFGLDFEFRSGLGLEVRSGFKFGVVGIGAGVVGIGIGVGAGMSDS